VAGAASASDVVLERLPGGVEAVAEQLDRELQPRPVAVDLVAFVVDVRAREREVVALEQPDAGALELAEQDVATHRRAQLANAVLARVAGDAGLDLEWVVRCLTHAS
jgi:hypothetical protein